VSKGIYRGDNMNDELWKQIIDTVVSSLFDPNPICFNYQHEKGILPIREAVSNNSPNQIMPLKKLLCRNAFLLGCLDFTYELKTEYLIIGYGIKKGRGTDILQVEYNSGNEFSVTISEETKNRLSQHIQQGVKNEAIVFHNHPPHWINSILDNAPLASTADRDVLLRNKYLEPLILLKTIFRKGSMRFFLGENDFVREYRIPNILQLLVSIGINYGSR
jgi:hypothetical protein